MPMAEFYETPRYLERLAKWREQVSKLTPQKRAEYLREDMKIYWEAWLKMPNFSLADTVNAHITLLGECEIDARDVVSGAEYVKYVPGKDDLLPAKPEKKSAVPKYRGVPDLDLL